MVGHPPLGWRQAFINLHPAKPDVIGTVKRQRFGRCPVTACTADLLIIGLDRLGQVGMRHPANVRLVDPHAKGDGGHDDQPVVCLKPPLDLAPRLGLHAPVIGQGLVPRVAQGPGERLGLGPRPAIDDPRQAFARGGKAKDLLTRSGLWLKCKVDIGPVEPAEKLTWLGLAKKPRDDLSPRLGICGRGKSGKRHIERATERADPQVIGPEIVAPLTNAMSLVNRQKGYVGVGQHPVGPARREALGRHVEKLQRAVIQTVKGGRRFLFGIARGQRSGCDARLFQRADLIAHQCDQRRDHDGQPRPHQRGQLKTQRFAPARWQNSKNVLSRRDGVDDIGLHRAKARKAENVFQ